MNYSVRKAKLIINSALDNAVDDKVLLEMENKSLFKITKNKKNEIESIDYNTYLVNVFLKDISTNVDEALKREEKTSNNIYFYVPMGSAIKNPLFNDKGPKIPVKIKPVGSILSGVKTNIKEYGINNALIEMYVSIEIEEKVILPVSTRTIKVYNEIPISYKIIQGVVPSYYGGEISKNSSIYTGLLNKN